MSDLNDSLESLFREEIRREWDKNPMWPHETMQDAVDWGMEQLAAHIFKNFMYSLANPPQQTAPSPSAIKPLKSPE